VATNTFSHARLVYVPAQYVAGTAAPFMLVQDGGSFTGRIPPILDNMINAHQLPAHDRCPHQPRAR